MVRAWAWLCVGFELAGCAHEPHEAHFTLRDLDRGSLAIAVSADGTDVTLTLGFATNACAVVDGQVTVTIDEVSLQWESHGAYVQGPVDGCEIPTLHATAAVTTSAGSQIVLGDGTTTVAATVVSLRMSRAFSAVGRVQRGADARFAWSVGTDTAQSVNGAQPLPGLTWAPLDASPGFDLGPGFHQGGLVVDGTTLVASIPANANPVAGTFDFLPMFAPTFTSCNGIGRCDGVPPNPGSLDATIAP